MHVDTHAVIGAKSLRGYLLEEVVSRMLQDNGYRLLSDLLDDTDALVVKKGTLYVKGRGSDHQADALGDLLTPIPFGLPVRLFVEAKCYGQKVDLPVLRNAHGVIHDVNQCYATATGTRATQRYDYRYAVFSTSGFTAEADDFAKAHQISLHDLSGDSAATLRAEIATAASALLRAATSAGLTRFPLHAVRLALRAVLGTLAVPRRVEAAPSLAPAVALHDTAQRLPAVASLLTDLPTRTFLTAVRGLVREASRWRFLVGYPDGRSVLALRSDDVEAFSRHCQAAGTATIPVAIHYAPGQRRGHGEYVVAPQDPGVSDFRLRFGVPDIVVRDVLTTAAPTDPALDPVHDPAKTSTITIFHDQRTVQLSYIPQQVPPEAAVDAATAADWYRKKWTAAPEDAAPEAQDGDHIHHAESAPTASPPRSAGSSGQVDVHADTDADAGPWVRWTPTESKRLLEWLTARSRTRATLLLDLSLGRKKGLGRSDVLASIGRDRGRQLQGVINPIVFAVAALQRDGQIREELRCPVRANKRHGQVEGYLLSNEVRTALRPVAKERQAG